MKEISFKMRKNYERNRKFCVVKVETLIAVDEESSFIYDTVSRVIVKTSKVINTKE